MSLILGTDTGGTFTDCVLINEKGEVYFDKDTTTPHELQVGVLNALANIAAVVGGEPREVLRQSAVFAHGTTVGLNSWFTRSGPKVGLLTTQGHEDAILIGRVHQKVAGLVEREITNAVALDKEDPIVPRPLIRGVAERIDAHGQVAVPLQEAQARRQIAQLLEAGVEAIAIAFLWSFLNPSHERRVKALVKEMAPHLFTSISSELAPVINDYERTVTTAINSYLGPTISAYMRHLDGKLRESGFSRTFVVMQSMGGTIPALEAENQAVSILNSGPIGGVLGSQFIGKLLGHQNIISTDVGGTSFDVGIIANGEMELNRTPVLAKYALSLPMVDIHSIGAGGGSIAWIEPHFSLLQVGPKSAGADPGPVCYGRGGTQPTVTDANLVLGRLNADFFHGGRLKLDAARAEEAIRRHVAKPLGWDVPTAAKGIIDIVDAHMADLIRKVTIEKGHDPRDFVLYAFGGMGPTHAGAYAREIGITNVLVSPYAPVFSAFGIAASDLVRFYARSEPMLAPGDPRRVNGIFRELERAAMADLRKDGIPKGEIDLQRSVDMKFRFQIHELRVPLPPGPYRARHLEEIASRFIDMYEQTYGKGTAFTKAGIEMSTFRVHGIGRMTKPVLKRQRRAGSKATVARKGWRAVLFSSDEGFVRTPIYDEELLRPGHRLKGPAIIEGKATTVVVHPWHTAQVDGYRNIMLEG
ncbi:MAG: hydantoinase/oxoprolinase family protein [Candidatus Tectomicrobia bacterium]|nr:hydantoinase/oxoprolinase family protein [Candidatus Tectomicrobia bacterium]